jgi:hypothetical protein
MSQPTESNPGALVVHGRSATLFAAVGEPVPSDAQMGVAEARARANLVAAAPIGPRGASRPAALRSIANGVPA